MSCPKTDVEWRMFRAAQLPGPGDHQPAYGFSTLSSAGQRFNQSNPKSDVDWKMQKAAQEPSPGSHQPSEGFSSFKQIEGGHISVSNAPSEIEAAIHLAARTPAPGDTQPRFGYSTLANAGGRISKTKRGFATTDHKDWDDVPAPGEYKPSTPWSKMPGGRIYYEDVEDPQPLLRQK